MNELERPIGTYLYGRRMYETMVFWERQQAVSGLPSFEQDYARIWRGAVKIVYSRTLDTVSSERTRIEREFDADAVVHMKSSASRDISIGGPTLAAHAFREGVVDECHLFLTPVVIGGGNRALPDNIRMDLELLDERRFGNGVVHLHYRAT